MIRQIPIALTILGVGLSVYGCSNSETTDTKESRNHTGHEHSHGGGHTGSHSHTRQAEPLHGGRIVAIGHSHHDSGVKQFHAEILPAIDGLITFYILVEKDGEIGDFPIESSQVDAYINQKDGEPTAADELVFKAVLDSEKSSKFVANIPEQLSDVEHLIVVIPKISLEGKKRSFSFSVEQSVTEDNAESSSQSSEDGEQES